MRRDRDQAASSEFFREQVGENLLDARERAELSRDELAAKSGVDARMIKMLERGERGARLESALRLSEALELPLDSMVLGIGWVPARQVSTGGYFVRSGGCSCRRR